MRLALLTWVAGFTVAGGTIGSAAEPIPDHFDQGPVFSLIEENDLIVDTDRHYTQGIKLSFLHRDGWLPGILGRTAKAIPEVGYQSRTAKFGYEVGQNIYTPGDTGTRQLLEDDRPYAGWLYLGVMLQKRGYTAGRFLTLESVQVDLGIIGPESLAENAQNWIHKLRHFDLAEGWDNQLDTEPGLALRYQRSLSLPLLRGGQVADVIPHAGMSLGNVDTSFRLGTMARLGWNLPRDFGPQTISSLTTSASGRSISNPGAKFGFYVFTAVEGSAVLYSAFLDGNLWHASHDVSRELWVGEWRSGFVFVLRPVEFGFSYVARSHDFEEQHGSHSYGSVFLQVKF